FIVRRKDHHVTIDQHLHQLNEGINCKQYPLPIIMDIYSKQLGYQSLTKLDINVQYFTFQLEKERKDLSTIIIPFGKYKYLRLLMGLKCSPDIAQSIMESCP
ncbi:hypothetical protein ACHAW6_002867, partial [Cyclotella cf. meneghiniana]